MTDKDQLSLLKRRVEAWNAWRVQNPSVRPGLQQADLRGADLRHANLRDADLARANLQGASLVYADLTSADLNHAHLSGTNLEHAILVGADLSDAVLGNPEILRKDFWHIYRYPGDTLQNVIWAPLEDDESLRYSEYVRYHIPDDELETWRNHIMGSGHEEYRPAILSYANLEKASLERAICDRVTFSHARLVKANLTRARLVGADFSSADLTDANVLDADLSGAVVSRATLKSTKRNQRTDWADTQAGVFEGSVQVYTHGFHEYLTSRTVDSPGDFHVTFIHGTFAREADWVDQESALAHELAHEVRQLDSTRAVHTHAFRWSGRNTFHARREAANGLRAHLRNLIRDHPTGIHCAVAHSHGGNVLLHALLDHEIAERIARVVCISTPFLRIVSTTDEWESTFSWGLKILEAIGLVAFALWLRTLGPRSPLTYGHPVLFALFLELLLIVAFLAVNRGTDATLKRWKGLASVICGTSGHPQLRLDQAICIRTASDEAGFALGLGGTFAWLIERAAILVLVIADFSRWLLFRPIASFKNGWAMVIVTLTSCVALLLTLFVILLPQSPFLPAAYAALSLAGVFLLPGLLLLPFLLLLSVCYIPFGYELAICTPFLRATAEAAPSGIWYLFQFPNLELLPLFKLQHSFVYEYSSLRLFIARWLVSGEFISMSQWRGA